MPFTTSLRVQSRRATLLTSHATGAYYGYPAWHETQAGRLYDGTFRSPVICHCRDAMLASQSTCAIYVCNHDCSP
ncbi:MAG: hypothetical protein HC817_09535 [Saprospiraceae bacterium]|nr:hypothetical protein [Saprospiraceae bacterium]